MATVELSVWARLATLAAQQHGLFTLDQARQFGVSRHDIRPRLSDGWIRHVRRDVYAYTGGARSRWEDEMAAALAGGPGTLLSHHSAATIHRLWDFPGHSPVLTVIAPQRVRLTGVVVHRVEHLAAIDIERRSGVALTSPTRTLVDLAGWVEAPLLERILEDGVVRRRWTYRSVDECLARAGTAGRRGSADLGALVRARRGDPRGDSRLEQQVIRILRPLGPFEVHFQVIVGGGRVLIVDVAWPHFRVAVEVDGWQHDGSSMAEFTRDRSRRNALQAAGWSVGHITAGMTPETILVEVGRLLPDWFSGPILARRALRVQAR
ncbi:MAG: type IV toxin-antitoxin system AbiEi family antitoxin domain-containing protein [Acidimicrobiales bacterium]